MSSGHDCAPTPPVIGTGDLLKQAWADLATKEVQTTPTYSYQWIADQFGHVGLGLALVLLLRASQVTQHLATVFVFLGGLVVLSEFMWATIQGRKHKALWRRIGRVAWRLVLLWVGYRLYAAYENEPLVETFFSLAVPLAIFFIKEVADVVDAFARIRKAGSFDGKRNRRHILQNAAVAVWYMWLGALTAYGVLFNYPYELWLAFFIALFAPLSRWLPEKIRFQQAQLPYLFRLAEFPSANLSRAEIGALESFLNDSVGSATPRHVVIVGTLGAGKTTLAAGLGTEAAFNQKKVRFLSFDKLQDIVVCGREPVPPRGTEAWKWRESQLLIIDDVLGLQPRAAGTFGGALKSLESVVGCLRQRCTVWVMPSIHSLVEMQDELRAFLQSELLVITLFDGGDLRSVGPSRHHPARAEQT